MLKKCRLIWDDCTPTRERRPTTEQDIEEDIHIVDYDTAEDMFQAVLDLAGYDEDDLDIDYNLSMKEKIEEVLGYLDDPGDGSPNILYASIYGVELAGTMPYDDLNGLDLEHINEKQLIKVIKGSVEYDVED